jgi:translation initiation factor 1A
LRNRELVLKTDGQAYAKVTRLLGNCQVEAFCFDGHARRCIIRGNMRRRIWVAAGDFILVGLRDYQDDTADVIHKYTEDEARNLVGLGHVPDSALTVSADGDAIQFREDISEDEINVDEI